MEKNGKGQTALGKKNKREKVIIIFILCTEKKSKEKKREIKTPKEEIS